MQSSSSSQRRTAQRSRRRAPRPRPTLSMHLPLQAVRDESRILMGKNTMIRRCLRLYAERTGNDQWLQVGSTAAAAVARRPRHRLQQRHPHRFVCLYLPLRCSCWTTWWATLAWSSPRVT